MPKCEKRPETQQHKHVCNNAAQVLVSVTELTKSHEAAVCGKDAQL